MGGIDVAAAGEEVGEETETEEEEEGEEDAAAADEPKSKLTIKVNFLEHADVCS
jgi:hypothetical protein